MRFFDEVEVFPIKPDGYPDMGADPVPMPAHLSWTDTAFVTGGTSPGVGVRARLRMVFPADYDLRKRQVVLWRGTLWNILGGQEIHTRRGRVSHRSADLVSRDEVS